MAKLLLCEDDAVLNKLLATVLRDGGFELVTASDGEAGLLAFSEEKFDMVISDVMMPKLDGFALAEEIRRRDAHVPILFITARDDKPSKLYGYKIGIDDYVTKPFDLDVFLMKVSALLRRAGIENAKTVTVGNFTMKSDERCAEVDGEEISFTVREFDILFKLLSYPKKTFTRAALMEEFWDYDSSATSRTVDVYMAKIREKTASCTGFEIQTVHGLGYKAVFK